MQFGAGTCQFLASNGEGQIKDIKNVSDINSIENMPIVWYKKNEMGEDGCNIFNSFNYTVLERTIDYINGYDVIGNYSYRIQQLNELISQLRSGLTENIVICIAEDTTYNKSVIVDGVKRAISMCYFSRQEPHVLNSLFISNYRIFTITYRSKICHKIFPCDFNKLIT